MPEHPARPDRSTELFVLRAPDLRLTHFRLIAALSETRNLGKAAEMLGISQPAASRLLAEAETTVGASICTRLPRGVEMTRLGQMLARRAGNLLLELRDTAREIAELRNGSAGTASVGAVTGGAIGFLVPAIQQLMAVSPHADVTVDVSPSDVLVRDLLAGRLDFALARVPAVSESSDIVVEPGLPEAVVLMVRRDHPLSAAPMLDLADLRHHHWIMQSPGTPIRNAVDAAFRDRGIEQPRTVTNSTSLLVTIAMVSSSTAIAPVAREVLDLLSGSAVAARFTDLPLPEPITITPYHLLTARHRTLSPLADRLRLLVSAELSRR
ncbi:MAG: LysR family transcriptional regulator [Paracoccaceae bacterium]